MTLDEVCSDVAEQLYLTPAEVSDSEDLFADGLDSVRLLGLVERWRDRGAEITFADLAERPTLAAWWTLLRRAHV